MSFNLVQVMFTFSELCGLTVMNPTHSDEFLQLGYWYEQDQFPIAALAKYHKLSSLTHRKCTLTVLQVRSLKWAYVG